MADDNFKLVKEMLDAREVLTKILGAPLKVSGEECFWNSLNKPNERTPSLGANKEMISDFSENQEMGKKLDVTDFVVYYNNNFEKIVADREISQIEALQWLVKEFNLDVDISTNYTASNKSLILSREKVVHTTKTYSLIPSTHTPIYGIATKFDNVPFSKKPEGNEVGAIKNRVNDIDGYEHKLDEVKEKLVKGYTCIPARN